MRLPRLLPTCLNLLAIFSFCISVYPLPTQAGRLIAISDTLSTPVPGQDADHLIKFAAASTIPASGKIVFTPQPGIFNIPAGLDYTDVDVAINLIDKPVAAIAGTGSGSAFGVSVTSGSNGSITVTLNDSDAINNGDTVYITIGRNAIVGTSGDQQITNPGSVGSYNEVITSKNASNITIDSSTIQIALINTIGIDATAPNNSVATPDISPNGGSFTGPTGVSISTVTPSSDIYYTVDGSAPTISSTLYTGPFTISTTTTLKAYAVKSGFGDSGIATAVFTITIPPPPPPSGGGGGGGGGGSSYFPTPVIYTDAQGEASVSPGSNVQIVHICPNGTTIIINLPANFAPDMTTFTISCIPAQTVPGSNTIAGQIATNTIFSIVAKNSSGVTIPALSNPAGLTIGFTSTAHIPVEDSILYYSHTGIGWDPVSGQTPFSLTHSITGNFKNLGLFAVSWDKPITPPPPVIEQGCPTAHRADLNCDNRVNLIDLSILLYNWGEIKNNPRADINKDGSVGLVDFSILLFSWTD